MTAATQERIGKLTFQVAVGALIRSQFRFQVEIYAKQADLRLEVLENKGWFETDYYIELHGVESRLRQAQSDITSYIKQLGARDRTG